MNGDLVTVGGNILVNGDIFRGDIFAVGGDITILGDISDDVRVAGGNILINGSVGGDVVAAGGQIQLSGDGISGDVMITGGALRIDVPIKGNVTLVGGEVYLNTAVTGNVDIKAGEIILGDGVIIHGNLVYRTDQELEFEEGQVRGSIEYTPNEGGVDKKAFAAGLLAFLSIWFLTRILMTIVAGFVLLYLFRRYLSEIVKNVYTQPWMELLRGFIILVTLPIASVILLISVIGIPLGIIGLISYILIIIFAGIIAPIIIGSLVNKWITKDDDYVVTYSSIVIGAVVYHLLGLVPIVGGLIKFGFFLIAIGVVMYMKWKFAKDWR